MKPCLFNQNLIPDRTLYKKAWNRYHARRTGGGRRLKRRDVWVIAAVLAAALLLLLAGRLFRPAPPEAAFPTLTLSNAASLGSGDFLNDAESYLRIKQGKAYYDLVPLNGPGEIVIRQNNGWENVIHIDKNSVVMHSANCPNHDCIRQGMMTMDNIDTRVFQSWITCLPHELSLELITREDALRLAQGNP